MTTTVWDGAQKSAVAVRSVLIYDQRAAAREALTHAVTAAMPSVIHIACVAGASDLSTAFARNPADLVFIGLQDATAGTVDATHRFLQRYPSAPVVVFGAVDDTPVLAAAVARGARGLMLWLQKGGRALSIINADDRQLQGTASLPTASPPPVPRRGGSARPRVARPR